MSQFKLPALEGILYYLHRQGHTPQSAYTELLSITGEETMTQEEVVDFFGMINHGTFGIKEIDEESKLHLTQQVDEVYNKIMENLDLNGRLSLLATCKKLREVSQTKELHIKSLTINFSPSYFQLLTDDGYRKTILLANHSKNTNDYENWDESYPPFMDEITDELRKVFQFEAIRIDSLNLMMEDNQSEDHQNRMISDFFYNLEQILSRRPIEVKSLKSNCPSTRVLTWVVKCVEGLKHVKFVKKQDRMIHFFDTIQGVMDVERFTSVQFVPEDSIVKDLGHVSYCKIVVEFAPTVEVLMELKEKLLLNPQLQQFKIRSRRCSEIYNRLNEHFKTYVMPGAKIPINQIFNYPGSQTDKLSFYATDQLFWFKGPCYADNEEPDEEPEGVDDGFAWDRNVEWDRFSSPSPGSAPEFSPSSS